MNKNSDNGCRIRFFGVRGSIPSSPDNSEMEEKLFWILKNLPDRGLSDDRAIHEYIRTLPPHRKHFVGGNTACVYINVAGQHIIFDAGSGLRRLGEQLMHGEFGRGKGRAHIFLSHTHWDHILGFPAFLPAFRSGNQITIYGVHNSLEQRISTQQEDEFFPVSLSAMGANIDFVQLRKEESINLGEVTITNRMLNHPGGSFGYRLDYRGRSLVYATDSEYKNLDVEIMRRYIEFFQDADVLIFDAQFTIEESIEKENWGHSTSIQGVNFAREARVKNLFFFHHDPTYSDNKLQEILDAAIAYHRQNGNHPPINIALAREGLEFTL